MSETLFINLLQTASKEVELTESLHALKSGVSLPNVHIVKPEEFAVIPGAPFSYWATQRLRGVFRRLSALGDESRAVKQGLATADDFRFVRAWWEVSASQTVSGTSTTTPDDYLDQTFNGKRWVPFAKGGAFSPYYADLYLVVNWGLAGAEIKRNVNEKGQLRSNVGMLRQTESTHFFRPGLTWPRRTNGLSFRVLPAGAVFADKGPAIFALEESTHALLTLAGVINSTSFLALIRLMIARVSLAQSFEVGLVQKVPVPEILDETAERLASFVREAIRIKSGLDSYEELSHSFHSPALLAMGRPGLLDALESWNDHRLQQEQRLNAIQKLLDAETLALYDLTEQDLVHPNEDVSGADHASEVENDEEMEESTASSSPEAVATDMVSYLMGLLFGRWDIRSKSRKFATHDPFAPLPPCSPAMFTIADGHPASSSDLPMDYPLTVNWTGIVVEDEGHPSDILTRLRLALTVVLPNADQAEMELCQLLQARDLRSWISQRFFGLHLKRYTKSKRKAPIYWHLRSARKNYGLWLYYPHLTRDTLFIALREYVEPKLAHEQDGLQYMRTTIATARDSGGQSERTLARRIEAQQDLVQEISAFRDELKAVADAGYDPDLNDGVLINAAPLHKLMPGFKEAAACYKELKAGKYPWSTLAQKYHFR